MRHDNRSSSKPNKSTIKKINNREEEEINEYKYN
jgi:hypothetical protein